MNYKEWLKTTIEQMLHEKDPEINLEVTEYSNAVFSGNHKDCAIVINGLGGTTDADVEVVPIQLMCLSGTQFNEDGTENETYDIFYEVLKKFCQTYNMTSMILNDFDYYKHSYVQPFPINALEADAGSYRLNFVVSGSLTISREIQDIKKVYVNNEEIKFLDANISYVAALSGASKMTRNLITNKVQNASISVDIRMYHRDILFTRAIQKIRKSSLNPNQRFHIKLQFTNDEVEEYYMIISSFTLSSDRINPSICNINFAITNEPEE